MKTVLYARSSISTQEHSIEMQKTMATELAKKNHDYIAEIYIDESTSALKTDIYDRPGLTKLLQGIEVGEITTLYVYKRDRLARNVSQYLAIYNIFKSKKLNVKFVADNEFPIQYTPASQFIELIFAGLAEQEGQQIKSRIRATKYAKVKNNEYPGGNVPYGYTKKGKQLVICKEEADNLKQLFNAFMATRATKVSSFYDEIRNELWFDLKWETRDKKGLPRKNNIKNYINKPRYKGVIILSTAYDNEVHSYPEHMIIDPIIWDAANHKLDTMIKKKLNKNIIVKSFLTPFLICKKCNQPLIAYKNNLTNEIFLQCKTHKNNKQQQSILANEIINQITNYVVNSFEKNFQDIIKEVTNSKEEQISDKVKQIECNIKTLENTLYTATEQYLSHPSDDKVKFRSELLKKNNKLYDLIKRKRELYNVKKHNTFTTNIISSFTHSHTLLDKLTQKIMILAENEKHALLNEMVDKIIVWNTNLTIYIKTDYTNKGGIS